jgi:hypothetical protein
MISRSLVKNQNKLADKFNTLQNLFTLVIRQK